MSGSKKAKKKARARSGVYLSEPARKIIDEMLPACDSTSHAVNLCVLRYAAMARALRSQLADREHLITELLVHPGLGRASTDVHTGQNYTLLSHALAELALRFWEGAPGARFASPEAAELRLKVVAPEMFT